MLFIEYCTESEKRNGCMGTMLVSVSVVYPHDLRADWEL